MALSEAQRRAQTGNHVRYLDKIIAEAHAKDAEARRAALGEKDSE